MAKFGVGNEPQQSQMVDDIIDFETNNDSNVQQEGNANYEIGVVERYDNEGEFFELLKRNDHFLHHLITEKIKYFDPAFHSISPEGFNARLTFLHQCTRQGSTVGASDSAPQNTAYNLSFGRPPVCVLRLGDFFNTKIIINSIGIQYEQPIQWDLNPEGIGVMPMFAKVNINFAFLGGSDLAGPISRLQNAVSFNYYSNTSVYDNRAEMVEYDPNGSGKETKFKPYSYPDMIRTGKPKPKEMSPEAKEAARKLGEKFTNTYYNSDKQETTNDYYNGAEVMPQFITDAINGETNINSLLNSVNNNVVKNPQTTTHKKPQVNELNGTDYYSQLLNHTGDDSVMFGD